jgi:DNA-binding transcriptional regulator YiaG
MPFHQDYLGVEQPAVGQLIRELRQILKLAQEKFATQLGVTFPTIAGTMDMRLLLLWHLSKLTLC